MQWWDSKNGPMTRCVNAVCDEFESRICLNCTWYVRGGQHDCFVVDFNVLPKDFGCNKFERVSNEQREIARDNAEGIV